MIATKDGSIFIDYEGERKEISGSGGGQSDDVGVIKLFGGSNAPDGWLLCDGSAVSRTVYSDLFKAIGTTYGEGDGSTTFNVPNIKGKTVIGLDSDDTDFNTLGKTGGSKYLQAHSHDIKTGFDYIASSGSKTSNYAKLEGFVNNFKTETSGEGNSGNLQPYITLNYIIRAISTTMLTGDVIDSLEGDSSYNAPSVHAVNEKLNELVDKYSTDEIIIGTYLGKPLYRKILNLGTFTGTTTTSHQTGLTNVKYLTKFEGTCICENTYGMKLPTNGDQIDSVIFRARLENNFSILKTERSNNSFQNVFFTIEYTKTTD